MPLEVKADRSGSASCRFCWTGERHVEHEFWNAPLLESANFRVIPSLGSLVEGWLLVVPNAHYISAGAMPSWLRSEFWEITHRAQAVLSRLYGPTWLFEHGPAAEKRMAGCGVDHAHVHLVPVREDLIAAALQFLPEGVRFRASGFEECSVAWQGGVDYLFAMPPGSLDGQIATGNAIGSQVFRRAIAQLSGRPAQYNWRENPGFDQIGKTINRIRGQLPGADVTEATA